MITIDTLILGTCSVTPLESGDHSSRSSRWSRPSNCRWAGGTSCCSHRWLRGTNLVDSGNVVICVNSTTFHGLFPGITTTRVKDFEVGSVVGERIRRWRWRGETTATLNAAGPRNHLETHQRINVGRLATVGCRTFQSNAVVRNTRLFHVLCQHLPSFAGMDGIPDDRVGVGRVCVRTTKGGPIDWCRLSPLGDTKDSRDSVIAGRVRHTWRKILPPSHASFFAPPWLILDFHSCVECWALTLCTSVAL